MPIVVVRKDEDKGSIINLTEGIEAKGNGQYEREKNLQSFLEKHPNLIREESGPDINFIKSEVILPNSGRLDSLFVDSTGTLIAVEVKLAKNPDANEVAAQALNYLSDITRLTADELNRLVNNELESALKKFAEEDEEKDIDTLWSQVDQNLRAAKTRLMVVMDESKSHPDLERIFRFLAHKANLDVQLITIQHYSSPSEPDMGKIYVPNRMIKAVPESRLVRASSPTSLEDWDTFVNGLNNKEMIAFIKEWKERGQKILPRSKRLVFPQQGEKWRIEPKISGHAWVMQGGRFRGDEEYWKGGLSSSDSVTVHREGMRLHFHLYSKKDFDFFWESITQTLKGTDLLRSGA